MPPSYVTQEGLKKLKEELEYLRTTRREEVADRLHKALEERSGEFIEDAEFEAAKNEQAFVEGRIKELETLIANARIIENSGNSEVVQVGAKVTIRQGRKKPEKYVIVGATEANPREGRISNESPLGIALLDREKGDLVEVKAPSGSFKVRIVKIE